ncbi:nodulation protein NolL; involved in acetylation of Nodulation factor (plasmid) [Sinorhizobium fredii NGR234]|uniref:Nodulation protein NolL n=1 Tax=Sinorhizobium fredii (strain NBRC 101917 / NGR234) TaxID=394 RepID=NOLL_SINFN|nr:nodulation factor fucose acetyltransferase NolL [Sinorhizobium fredii]P55431.1 RecName: Full=Nodulation protein NolL [Sinorhizobium fredii NGR234]AAB91652.1 nodulation protein NolL; involved in acetylation of Nodulation factor [Sinorhizobium fredii NGR234]
MGYAAVPPVERGSCSAGANNRDITFDFVKGILIILVVLGHLLQLVIYRNTDNFWLSPYFKAIYMFHMPLFMAISGYLASGTILRTSFCRAVGDRAVQLLIPMLFWCALIETAKLAAFFHFSGVTAGLLDFSRELVGTYWFLWAVLASFLLTKLFAAFNLLSKWILCASAIVIALMPITLSIVPLLRYTYPFFCLGFLFAQTIEEQANTMLRHKSLLMFSCWAVACLCFLDWGRDTYAYNNLVLVHDAQSAKQVLLMFTGSAAAAAVAAQSLFHCWRVLCSTRLARLVAVELGQSTLLLYLVQGAVFRLTDLIQFGELWDGKTRIVVASAIGAAIFGAATAVLWIVNDLGYVSRIIVGAPRRLKRSS